MLFHRLDHTSTTRLVVPFLSNISKVKKKKNYQKKNWNTTTDEFHANFLARFCLTFGKSWYWAELSNRDFIFELNQTKTTRAPDEVNYVYHIEFQYTNCYEVYSSSTPKINDNEIVREIHVISFQKLRFANRVYF